jgi:plastocyanin
MTRLLIVIAGFSVGIALTVGTAALGAGPSGTAAKSAKNATIMIRHQTRGCHSWSVNGGAYRASQAVRLARGAAITFVDNDVMPHKLIKTSGPAVHFRGSPAMRRMGASVKAVFAKGGTYRFTTKAGEDYMPGMKTVGEDNVLRLTVTVR